MLEKRMIKVPYFKQAALAQLSWAPGETPACEPIALPPELFVDVMVARIQGWNPELELGAISVWVGEPCQYVPRLLANCGSDATIWERMVGAQHES